MGILRNGKAKLALPLAMAMALSVVLVNPASVVAVPADPAARGTSSLVELAMSIAAPGAKLLDYATGAQAVGTGRDGRLTMVLYGSDSRGSSITRTDTIMIVSVKNKSISIASIPRDTARIPNPAGGTFSGKVNGLIRSFILGGMSRDAALARMDTVLENLLKIEIDYYAVMWFGGLTTLVGKVDPITVSIPKEIRDPKQLDAPGEEWGVYFPASSSYSLYDFNPTGNSLCTGKYKFDTNPPVDSQYWCRRALPFVRTRKGPGNNDWVRSARQQHFIFRTVKSITSLTELQNLYNTARFQGMGKWITNMPLSLSNAQDLYSRLAGSTLSASVVFKPNAYATRISGTSGWQLKLTAVRSWTAANLK